MKKLITPILVVIFCIAGCKQTTVDEKMPITTNSEAAIELYKEAMLAFENIYFYKVEKLLKKSLENDPDFFMANFMLAFCYDFSENEELFKKYANNAMNCKSKLGKGETKLKEVLKKYIEEPKPDISEIGNELIRLYPKDILPYFILYMNQMIRDDTKGEVKTMKSALEIAERPAPVYNLLGYAYLKLDQLDEAEKAFNKYIELAPDIPNPYDSKGDFYMHIKDYQKAYDNFMKANAIDSLWGINKAMKAKILLDSLGKE